MLIEQLTHKGRFLGLLMGLLVITVSVRTAAGGDSAENLGYVNAIVPDGWMVECIDCPRYFTGMSGNSAALDSNGLVHTAYGSDGLYYAVQQPDGSYATEVVDEVPVRGLNASMVLDSNDQPHILYYARDFLRLFHAYKDGGNWHFNILSTPALTTLPHPWLAIDSGDNLHLAFISGNDLLYGRYNGSSWQIEMVDTDGSGNIGRPSLALDSSERPHIAYGRGSKYAYFDGTNWQITSFAGSFDYGTSIALALDQNDHPHLVYQTDYLLSGYLGLRYRYNDGSGWQEETIDGGIYSNDLDTGFDISLGLDSSNQPIVAYTVQLMSVSPYPWFDYYSLRISHRDQNGWHHILEEYFYNALYDTGYNTLLSGPGNDLTVVHKLARDLVATVWDGSDFSTSSIDEGGDSGQYIDLAVDNDDRLHFSAHEGESNLLRYGLKSQGGWSTETLLGGAGFYSSPWTSLAVSSDGRPYIMYKQYTRVGDTPYTYFDGQNWSYVYFSFNAATFQIALDSEDNFLAAHYCNFLCDDVGLNYIDGLENTTVDSGMVNAQVDIAVDSADFAHIAYPASDGLRYAVQTPSGWMTETVVAGDVDYPSLSLDRFGRPHIAWYEKSTADLMYAAYDGAAWQIDTIDSGGDVGQYASLAVDELGRVYVAYYDATNGDLKYATYDGNSWAIETLLSEGDVGSFSKLVTPYAGYPAIAYYDATSRDLKLVYRPFIPTDVVYEPVVRK